MSLVELLHKSVIANPDAEAIVSDRERVRYVELWSRVTAIAGFLRRQGLAPGGRVALLLENSPEYVASYYGVLAAGGVVVALNTAARARDLVNWMHHCDATWLIGQGSLPEWSAVIDGCPSIHAITTDSGNGGRSGTFVWQDALRAAPWDGIEPASHDGQSPAAIIYTSGTTGRPKGVCLSHRNLVANVQSILAYLPIGPDTRVLNVLPFYYSYGNSVMHTHLAAGACVVLENSLAYPHRVMERMVAEAITGFSGVPSTFALLLSRVRLQDYDLSRLQYLTQAGGGMSPVLMQRLREALPWARLFIMYGQTEATARLSYLPPERLMEKLGSAGVAIPGVEIEIHDESGRRVPRGTVGEIWATGENIMLGYWNDPEATGRVLRDGWLMTGDMASMDAEGFLFIEGRRSDMIKSGAHRIAPKEIEDVINEVDGVAEVAVVGVDDPILGQVIKAVVTRRPGAALDALTIKAHCRNSLAAYKVPKHVEFVSELPKTASGKVQRFRLMSVPQENKPNEPAA